MSFVDGEIVVGWREGLKVVEERVMRLVIKGSISSTALRLRDVDGVRAVLGSWPNFCSGEADVGAWKANCSSVPLKVETVDNGTGVASTSESTHCSTLAICSL